MSTSNDLINLVVGDIKTNTNTWGYNFR